MSKQIEALKLALKDLERSESAMHKARAIIREALAEQPAQHQDMLKIGCVNHDCDECKAQQEEPVAWMVYTLDGNSVCVTDNPADFTPDHRALPLYTSPPASKPWVKLTEEDILRTKGQFKGTLDVQFDKFAYAIEAKLRERNA